MANRYMHLMNGKPAYFSRKHNCMYFAGPAIRDDQLVKDLRTIRRQQQAAIFDDVQRGFVGHWSYDYLLIRGAQ